MNVNRKLSVKLYWLHRHLHFNHVNSKISSPAALKMIPDQSEPLCGRYMAIDQSVRILPVLSKYNSKRHIARLDIRLPNDETNSYSWSINDGGKYDDTQTYDNSEKYCRHNLEQEM